MRWIHLLGLGFVVGLTALGVATSIMLLHWNEVAYQEQASEATKPGTTAGGAPMPAEAAQGETIFRQRCQSCHTIGGGKLVGPDLAGIAQQRPRDFLIQMITDPAAALQTPTGQQLLQEYGVPMPDVGVNEQQAAQVLAYIDFRTGAAAPAKAGAPQPPGQPAPQASPATKAPGGAPAPGGAAPAGGDANRGKASFEQKCTSCHSIGQGRRVGPDLRGVTTQRSHEYLVNMITQPDRMTASDPTAQQLLKDYGVQMPNLGIQPPEAEDLIAYLRQQSGGALAPPKAPLTAGFALQSAHAGQGEHDPPVVVFHQLSFPAQPLVQQPAGNPDQGKSVFDQRCMGCHSIGGGRRAGPDLQGVTQQRPREWLVRQIVEPEKLVAEGDPTVRQLVSEYGSPMPNVGVSRQQAEDVLAYIAQQSGGQAAPGGGQQPQPIQPGNAANGQALFTGQRGFSAGGPACIACHNVEGIGIMRGGTWGLDLTKQQSKMGTEGIVGILKAPAFPGMKEAYANHPVTDAETADLAAFFIEVDSRQPSTFPEIVFPAIGLLAFLVMMAIAGIAWRGRIRRVRESLVGGARR